MGEKWRVASGEWRDKRCESRVFVSSGMQSAGRGFNRRGAREC